MKDKHRRPKSGPAAPAKAFAPARTAAQKPAAHKAPAAKAAAPKKEPRPAPEMPARPLMRREGEKPAERVPVILETAGSDQYRLIDSG